MKGAAACSRKPCCDRWLGKQHRGGVAANVLRDRGGNLQIKEAMLPAAAVSGGLCKEVLEPWDAGSHVSRQRDFGGSNGVGASQVMPVGALKPKVVHQPRLAFTDLATQGNHAEDDELVARGGIPSVVVPWLFLGAVELLDQGLVDLLMSVVEVLDAGRLHVPCLQANVMRKD